MNVPKAWIKIIYLISLIAQIYGNIDSKEYFCGKKLVKTLTELCSIYNDPSYGRNRFRRQIVQECCRSQCSRRYLVQYYCREANSSVAHLLRTKPENLSGKSTFNKDSQHYQSDDSRIVAAAEERNSLTKIKKARRLQSPKNLVHKPVPPPNIGHVENSQTPFYVWKFSRIL